MSIEEIIEWLERQVQKYEVCASCDALSPLAPKYRDSARIMRAAIEKLRTNTPAGDNADKNSDTSARLAAIKDIPTQRLIELAMAEAAGLISILPSAAERAHQDNQPNEPLTLEELRGMYGKPVWVEYEDGKDGGWGLLGIGEITFPAGEFCVICEEGFGQSWKAYRRPPKEDER